MKKSISTFLIFLVLQACSSKQYDRDRKVASELPVKVFNKMSKILSEFRINIICANDKGNFISIASPDSPQLDNITIILGHSVFDISKARAVPALPKPLKLEFSSDARNPDEGDTHTIVREGERLSTASATGSMGTFENMSCLYTIQDYTFDLMQFDGQTSRAILE